MVPVALALAAGASAALHLLALFATEIDISGPREPLRLEVELTALPPPLSPAPAALAVPVKRQAALRPAARIKPPATLPSAAQIEPLPLEVPDEPAVTVNVPVADVAPPVLPVLPPHGRIRYLVYKGDLGFEIGRAEQTWDFSEAGRYRLLAVTETSGLAALLRPTRIEQESIGSLVAGGLRPEQFLTRKNGQGSRENVRFDWAAGEALFERDESRRPLTVGSQDLLSLNYQMAYLATLAQGTRLGVATGRKYEQYQIESLGVEEIDVPAGHFRTLHLRVQTETVTELWIAIEQSGLAVKIRFTDKKGDSYQQVASEIGL